LLSAIKHYRVVTEKVALAKKLPRYPPKGRKRSLRTIAPELEVHRHVAAKRYGAAAVARMVAA
jgi:hypothetical protein